MRSKESVFGRSSAPKVSLAPGFTPLWAGTCPTAYVEASGELSVPRDSADEGSLRGSRSVARPSVKRRLLSGSAWATGGRMITAAAALATNALLARLLSPQD